MIRFEYKVLQIIYQGGNYNSLAEKLNYLGNDGWELVNCEGYVSHSVFIFKRVIPTI